MIESIYQSMWDNFTQAINHDRIELDPYLCDLDKDDRRGITALAYIHQGCSDVAQKIAQFQARVKDIEPHQYYHPINELHATILSIISCYSGFQLADINQQEYCEIFRTVLKDIKPITIHYRGVTASPNCIVMQGFPQGDGLNQLRDRLRDAFNQSGLQCSLDARYKLVTAHSSVVRFYQPLQEQQKLLELCRDYRNYDFGYVELRHFDLVFNDWYQRLAVTQYLEKVTR